MSDEYPMAVGMDSDHSDDDGEETMEEAPVEEQDEDDTRPNVYLPSQPLKEGEELVCDESAYIMLHQMQTGSPCLSFDMVKDELGERDTYPLEMYMVTGTQAPLSHANVIIVMKILNLHRTSKEDSEDEDLDSEDGFDGTEPQMVFTRIKHSGCINRIRTTGYDNKVFAASWSELGSVHVWDVTRQLQILDDAQQLFQYTTDKVAETVIPLYSFNGHQQEGYAVDWSTTTPGVLATGDCRRDIHIWKPTEAGTWQVDQRPLVGHTQSVEEVQWSPNESSVLASCSVDKTIRIWDTRAAPQKACMLTADNAHENDINVISWNKHEPFIASGGDDGFLHIWDLRHFQSKTPVATFKHHTAPITTVEWHPTEATILASGGADHQIALWDLSVEKDTDVTEEEVQGIPPQLLFIHQGQKDIKELHWHPQIPGVMLSTAQNGFNIFKTISV